MNRKITAVLLSMFILPGLGQLYLGRKGRGVALIVMMNILILAAVFLLLKSVGPALAARSVGARLTPGEVFGLLQGYSGAGNAILAMFLAVWGFGVVDALRVDASMTKESGQRKAG